MSSSRVIRAAHGAKRVDADTQVVTPVTWTTLQAGSPHPPNYSGVSGANHVHETRSVLAEEAEQVLQTAREEAIRARQAAYDEGYELGLKQGREDGEQLCKDVVATAQSQAEAVLEGASQQRDEIIQSLHGTLTDAVMGAVEALLHTPGVVERALVRAQVLELLDQEVGGTNVVIRLHPDDMERVGLQEFPTREGQPPVSAKSDTTLTRGGYVIESDSEEVDATVETRLELLRPKVQKLIGGLLDERAGGISADMQSESVPPSLRSSQ